MCLYLLLNEDNLVSRRYLPFFLFCFSLLLAEPDNSYESKLNLKQKMLSLAQSVLSDNQKKKMEFMGAVVYIVRHPIFASNISFSFY